MLACLIFSIVGWYNNKGEINPFPYIPIASTIIASLIACYFQFLLPKFSITTQSQVNDISVHDIDYFRKIYFDEIIGETKFNHVCIVVDNLDRVEAKDALAIIQTLKTFVVDAKEDINTKAEVSKKLLNKVVFVVPCSDEELVKHITDSKAVSDGEEFLHKFFNISFRIPKFRNQDAFQYAKELLVKMKWELSKDQESTICFVLSRLYSGNPRQSKIFLNNLLMRYNVAKACEEDGQIADGVITSNVHYLAIYMAEEEIQKQIEEQSEIDLGGLPQKTIQRQLPSEIANLRRNITPECNAALKYLKRPNDFDRISCLSDLLEMATSQDIKFCERLSERCEESQDVINAMWRNIDKNNDIKQLYVIGSVVRAIESNDTIKISPHVSEEMAWTISSKSLDELPVIPGKIVYSRLLKNKFNITNTVLGSLVPYNDRAYSPEQKQYCVDILEEMLRDHCDIIKHIEKTHDKQDYKEKLISVITRLMELSSDIVPIAIKYPELCDIKIFKKALEMCEACDKDILPAEIVSYCMELEEEDKDGGVRHELMVIECFNNVLEFYCDKDEWEEEGASERCADFIKSLNNINRYAYGENTLPVKSEEAFETIKQLFEFADDCNRVLILGAFEICIDEYKEWSGVVNLAKNYRKTRLPKLLQEGSEDVINAFIMNNIELMNNVFYSYLASTGKRYKKTCHLILDEFIGRRFELISEMWKDKSEWVSEWIKDNSSGMDRGKKRQFQKTLFTIASGDSYDIRVYRVLKHLKIGNDKEAKDSRSEHYDSLIEKYSLETASGFSSVLERVKAAGYTPTTNQNNLFKKTRDGMDHGIIDDKLKKLIKDVIC